MAKKTGIIEIQKDGEWVSLLDPSKMEFQIYDLDSEEGSGRNQKGLMFRDRVTIKTKLVCSFPPMTQIDLIEALKMVEDEFFTVRTFDPRVGEVREFEAYVGDRTAPMYTIRPDGTIIYQNLNMNIIER